MRAHGIAGFRLLVLLFACVAPALPASGSSPRSGDVRIIHRVDWVAPTRYTATVMITNMTTTPIDRWTLEFDLFPVIDVMQNASVSRVGSRHAVFGTGPMRSIGAGQMVWFTYEAEWNGSGVRLPAACRFNGAGCAFESLSPPPPNPHVELPVQVVYWVAWKGITQYRAQVWIRNQSDDPIDFWTMEFLSEATIVSIEHASWSSVGPYLSVAGSGWTRRIEPGEAVWITLEGVHTGDVPVPTACVFNGFDCEFLSPEDLLEEEEEEDPDKPFLGYCALSPSEAPNATIDDISVTFKWNSLWATGFTAAIEITNTAVDRPVRNWKLVFDMISAMTITRFWNGDLTRSGNRYTVTSLLHNSCIEPGVTVTFGFEGSHGGVPVKPTFCEFDGSACSFSARFSSTAREEDPVAVSPYRLDPVFPNPFSGSASVAFSTDRTQHLDLGLWDLQGRRVTTVFSGVVAAGAETRVSVDASALAPGTYFVRLVGPDGRSVTRPVTLVR